MKSLHDFGRSEPASEAAQPPKPEMTPPGCRNAAKRCNWVSLQTLIIMRRHGGTGMGHRPPSERVFQRCARPVAPTRGDLPLHPVRISRILRAQQVAREVDWRCFFRSRKGQSVFVFLRFPPLTPMRITQLRPAVRSNSPCPPPSSLPCWPASALPFPRTPPTRVVSPSAQNFVRQPAGQRAVYNFNPGWKFVFGDQTGAGPKPGFDDSSWTAVSLPHTWNETG